MVLLINRMFRPCLRTIKLTAPVFPTMPSTIFANRLNNMVLMSSEYLMLSMTSNSSRSGSKPCSKLEVLLRGRCAIVVTC